MKAVLLAAGLGTRLRPLTDMVPKCLADIDGRPLLDYWIELLSGAGVRDILVNLHYLPDQVRQYVKTCAHPARISWVFERRLLGTAGTLVRNRAFFGDEPVLLAHADNLSFFDVRAFIRCFDSRPDHVAMTMMTFRTDTPSTCGIVEIDASGIVHRFHEKVENPPSNLANAAVYILGQEVVHFAASLGKRVLDMSTEVLPDFLGRINTWHNDVYHRDIGTPQALAAAREEIVTLRTDARFNALLKGTMV